MGVKCNNEFMIESLEGSQYEGTQLAEDLVGAKGRKLSVEDNGNGPIYRLLIKSCPKNRKLVMTTIDFTDAEADRIKVTHKF